MVVRIGSVVVERLAWRDRGVQAARDSKRKERPGSDQGSGSGDQELPRWERDEIGRRLPGGTSDKTHRIMPH